MPAPRSDDELEALVFDCLESGDPEAELARRTDGKPELFAAASSVMAQARRLESSGSGNESVAGIPDVEVQGLIARGGQASVYRGRQTYLDRPVAVKVLAEQNDPSFVRRFRLEARTLAQLSHPHIVTCHQAGVTEAGRCYLVMELIDGPTLRHLLNDHGPLPVATALSVIASLCEALAAAHASGIVHRDVKPENVLLKPRPDAPPDDPLPFVPKLADLGLARLQQAGPAGTVLTRVGMLLGTPETMAPEQIDDPGSADHRADIYGLGCVLFHMLAGKPAFTGTMSQILAAKATRDGPDLSALPNLPAGEAALLRDLMARDPAARLQSYADVLVRVQQLQSPRAMPVRKGKGLLVAVAALLVVGTALLVRHFGADPTPKAPMVPRPLLVASETPMAFWPTLTSPHHWHRDDRLRGRTGVLLRSRDGRSEASRTLQDQVWELIGDIEPRGDWQGADKPDLMMERGGLRVELPGAQAIAVEMVPTSDACLTRILLLKREGKDWREAKRFGEWGGWGVDKPLALRCRWHADRLLFEQRNGDELADLAASEWGGGAPTGLSLYVVSGVVAFAEFILASR